MQKITVLCVGKLKEPFYEQAVKEYEKRLSRYCKLELLELPEQRLQILQQALLSAHRVHMRFKLP